MKVIQLCSDGIAQLLHDPGVTGACEDAARRIAETAGAGFAVTEARKLRFGGGRVGVGVEAETEEAKVAEAEDKVLSKAVSRCRL